jgi:hypothetical protein
MNAPFPSSLGAAALFHLDEAALRRRAAESARRIIALGARRMVREPWRIVRAVYPHAPAIWPMRGRPATVVLADCARMIAAQEAQGRADRWTYDPNRLIALRQAEDALLAIIMGDAPDEPEAA